MNRWRAAPDYATLSWRRWGEASFVYHPASGQTHFLNLLGAWILERLQADALTEAELVAAMVAAHDASATPELEAAVSASLRALFGIGLLERETSA